MKRPASTKRRGNVAVAKLNAPKARSAYALFMKARYSAVLGEKDRDRRQTVAAIGKEWRELDDEAKQFYYGMSQDEFQRRREHIDRSLDRDCSVAVASDEAQNWRLGSYELTSQQLAAGSGSFARVYPARHCRFGCLALAKVFTQQEHFLDEMRVHNELSKVTATPGLVNSQTTRFH